MTGLTLTALLLTLALSGCSESVPGDETAGQSEGSVPSVEESETEITETVFSESFDAEALNTEVWAVTSANDFNRMEVDITNTGSSNEPDNRLRLLADTMGTDDATVKFLGVRRLEEISLSDTTISYDLDWNAQVNGCYLTGGLFLCPVETDGNPAAEDNWLAFEYIGVPPGQNARLQVSRRVNGNFQYIYTEGWPDEQRTGREIGLQKLEITIQGKALKVVENGVDLFETDDAGFTFDTGWLYLQMSSHSNYPSREIYYDDIVVDER